MDEQQAIDYWVVETDPWLNDANGGPVRPSLNWS